MPVHAPLTTRPRSTTATALVLAALAFAVAACVPAPSTPATATPGAAGDDFAVVRATSVAAFANGRGLLERNQLEEALIELDRAKVTDPDQRTDIQEALDETIRRIQALPPTPAAPARTPIPSPTPLPAATPAAVKPAAPTTAATPSGFTEYADPQARFTVSVPSDWQVQREPRTEFGSGIVAFRDPSGKAELAIAADEAAQVVSPELYAARMELAMQQMPGYALDTVVPGVTAGNPSLRRNYSVRQREASSGASVAARGFQVAVLRGGTSYILSASAPVSEYPQFGRIFDQIVASFSFR